MLGALGKGEGEASLSVGEYTATGELNAEDGCAIDGLIVLRG